MRLIDADALVSALNNGRLEEQKGRAVPFNAGVAFALIMVEYAPTIDALPVVRCKNCKFGVDEYHDRDCYCKRPNRPLEWIGDWDFFCADGAKMEGDDDE